jgi:hypothetical protein
VPASVILNLKTSTAAPLVVAVEAIFPKTT